MDVHKNCARVHLGYARKRYLGTKPDDIKHMIMLHYIIYVSS